MRQLKNFFEKYSFITALVLYLADGVLMRSYINQLTVLSFPLVNLVQYVYYTVFALLVVKIIFFQKHEPKRTVIMLAIGAVLAVSAYKSGLRDILTVWLFAFAAADQDIDRSVWWACGTYFAMLAVVIVFCLLGVIHDDVYVRYGVTRHCLGFIQPNSMGVYGAAAVTCLLYCRRDKLGVPELLIAVAMVALLKIYPDSKTAYMAIILMVIMLLCYRLIKSRFNKLMGAFLICLVIVCAMCNIFTVAISLLYNGEGIMLKLNNFSTGRFYYAHWIYSLFGISKLGQTLPGWNAEFVIDGVKYTMPFLDSGYMNLLLRSGIVVYLLYSAIYIYAADWLRRRNMPGILIALTLYAVYGIMEPTIYTLKYNVFLLVLALPLLGYKHNEDDIDKATQIEEHKDSEIKE